MALGQYHAAHANYARALEPLAFAGTKSARSRERRSTSIAHIHCLLAIGQVSETRSLINSMGPIAADDPDLCITRANLERVSSLNTAGDEATSLEEYLGWLNRPLERAGFSSLLLMDRNRDLQLDNLAVSPAPAIPEQMHYKVSVLMAAHNCENTIWMAVRSVLDQSWQNLELIIVDDVSSDKTWRSIKKLAREDNRIIPLQHAVNMGCFAARNTALAHASGDLVVANDSDDWAHPQKIETQVNDWLQHGGKGANMTFRLRMNTQMVAQPRLDKADVPFVHNDFSSLMLSRSCMMAMGGWDTVRFSADAEFVQRFRQQAGPDSVRKLHAGVPLSFSLLTGNNLTTSDHISTLGSGARREYTRAFSVWHEQDHYAINRHSQIDPFPVPALLYPGADRQQHFDIVLVTDCRLPGGTSQCNRQYLAGFQRMGLRVGILNWERYDINPPEAATRKMIRACQSLNVTPIVHGESVNCDLLFIHHPPIMMWQPDTTPTIEAQRIAILANQTPQKMIHAANTMYEPDQVQERIQANFHKAGLWIPISPVVRRLLASNGIDESMTDHDWFPPLELSLWWRQPRWRGQQQQRPVVGRHSRDDWTKWPGTAGAIKSAYCANQAVDVRLMGGVQSLLAHHLMTLPLNWHVIDYDNKDVRDFLAELDIFVNFIHEQRIETFGRNVIEAMAAGLPVICSPAFRECFGNAAVYAEPEEALEVIESLWQDEAYYYAVAQAGQRFVANHCDLDGLPSRLQQFRGQ
ncbi:hypothetical protein J2T55_001583 [Methylohalomonas lacus]|uniref:Glycosyltransferase 2-like domain-containing protein n=1 Tax=Methylohalomonas lacus TaxID=398773 RepID=A0AAE3HN19_9GAMM|nr:glycosyltransferase [Methylohalomonas lacus]MCS3903557.1 hypothetical protein [Methylohalomonas lacus]